MVKQYRKGITAASNQDIDIEEIHNGAFADIAFALAKCGYEMTIDDNFNVTVECVSDAKFMPEIKINTEEDKGVYYLVPDLKFPELKDKDMDYADSVAYWVEDKWVPLARVITDINKFSYDPEEWIE